MNIIEEVLIGITAFIVISLGVIIFFQHGTITSLSDKVALLTTENGQCLSANENWALQVKSQNQNIAQLKSDGLRREAAMQKAVSAAETSRQSDNAHAASIIAQKVDANDCLGASQVLSSYLKGRHP